MSYSLHQAFADSMNKTPRAVICQHYYLIATLIIMLSFSLSQLAMAQEYDAYGRDVDSELGVLPQLADDISFTVDCKARICHSLNDHQHFKPGIAMDSIIRKPVSGGRLSSPYGWRIHPIYKKRRMHTGVDYAVPMNTPVIAAQHGKVVFAGWRGGYGRLVAIRHNDEYTTVYAHLNRLDVKAGDWVDQGQVIALSGNSGRSTGPHLHYEIRRYGQSVNPLEGVHTPQQLLAAEHNPTGNSEQRLSLAPQIGVTPPGATIQTQPNGRVRAVVH